MVNFSIKTWIVTKPFQYNQQTSVIGPMPIFLANGWIIGYGINKNKYDYVRFNITDWASREFIPYKFIQTTNGYIYFIGKVNTTVDYFTLQRSINNGDSWTSLSDSAHEFFALTEYYANSYLYIEEAVAGRMDIRLTGTGGPTNWQVVANSAKIGNIGVVIAGTGAFPLVNKNFVFIDETDYKIIETELDPLQTVTTRYTGNATNQPKEIIVLVDGVYYVEFYTGTAYEVRSVDLSAGTTSVITGTTGLHLYASDATYIYLSNIGRTGEYGDLRIYRYSTADGLELIYLLPIDGLVGIHGIAIEPVTGDLAVEFSNLLGTVYNNYQLVYTTNSRFRSCIVETEINGKITKANLTGAKSDISSIPLNIRAQIKNESDEVVFDGYCVQIQNNSLALFEGVDREILKKDANISIITQDTSEVFTALLLTNEETFAGTLAAGGNTYTQTWSNMKQGHVMLTLSQARAALFRSFIDIADSNKTKFDLILLSALNSSGIELTDANRSTYAYQMKMIEGSDKPEAVNKLILQGATNSNGTLQKTQGSGLPEKIVKRPDIIDAQLLTDYSAQLYADRNISSSFSKRYEISINKNAPFLKVGDTILASFEREQIALDTFIVLNQKYNYALKQSKIIVSKAIGAQPLMENQSQKGLTTAIIASDNTTGVQIVPVSDVDIRAGKFTIPVTVGDPVGTQDAVPKHLYDDVKTTADAAFPNSIATAKILGRTSAGTGVVEQLDLEQTATDSAAKMSSSAAVYKQMPKSGVISDDVTNFKNNYTDQFGTTVGAAPAIYSVLAGTDTCEISSIYLLHLYPIHCIGDVSEGIRKDITAIASLYYSAWICPILTSKQITFGLYQAANLRAGLRLDTSGNLQIFTDFGTYVTIQSYTANQWIHVFIDYNATRALYYVNKKYVGTNTVTTGVSVDRIYVLAESSDSEFYYDASYNGINFYAAWLSLNPSMISTPQFINASGQIMVDRLEDQEIAGIKTFTDNIIADDGITSNYIKVEDEGNFKNLYADNWGSIDGQTITGWSISNANVSALIASDTTHSHYVNVVNTVAVNYPAIVKTFYTGDTNTHSYISFWARLNSATAGSGALVEIRDAGNSTNIALIYMYISGQLRIAGNAGSVIVINAGFSVTSWHHYMVDVTKNATSYFYIDGTLIAVATANNDYVERLNFEGMATSMVMNLDVDAVYFGDSWLKAWSSMYDGHVADRARWTRYGERGFHKIPERNRSAYDLTESSLSTTGSWAVYSLYGFVPAGAKAVQLYIEVYATTAIGTMHVGSVDNGYDTVRLIPQVVGLYMPYNIQYCPIDSSLRLHYNRSAYINYLQLNIMGYWI